MQPDFQINHLKTLIAIDEAGNFGQAAKRIGRTQSAVTQQMQSLEASIGRTLFTAKGRNRELTEAGKTLLQYAREIVSLCNHAAIASARSHQTGTVKIGAPYEMAHDLLSNALSTFAQTWTNMRVVIHIDRSPNLMQMIEDGRLDLTISTRRSTTYESKLLAKVPVLWIAATGWDWDPIDPLPLALTDEPSMFRRSALAALDVAGQPYVEKFTSPSMAGIWLAVQAGLGVTARTKTTYFTGTQAVDEKFGLPPLPDIHYYMHRPVNSENQASLDLFDIIAKQSSQVV